MEASWRSWVLGGAGGAGPHPGASLQPPQGRAHGVVLAAATGFAPLPASPPAGPWPALVTLWGVASAATPPASSKGGRWCPALERNPHAQQRRSRCAGIYCFWLPGGRVGVHRVRRVRDCVCVCVRVLAMQCTGLACHVHYCLVQGPCPCMAAEHTAACMAAEQCVPCPPAACSTDVSCCPRCSPAYQSCAALTKHPNPTLAHARYVHAPTGPLLRPSPHPSSAHTGCLLGAPTPTNPCCTHPQPPSTTHALPGPSPCAEG